MNLTLSEFGCEIETGWSGSQYDYVIEILSRSADEPIEALAAHLNIADSHDAETEDAADALWDQGRFRLFISHLASYREYAHELKVHLAQYAISAFVAHDDITPTAEWISEIERALLSTDALVALVHEGFAASAWTDQEVGAVMGRRKPILAVRLGAAPHGFLGRYQAIPGGTAELTADRIFQSLANHVETRRAIAYAVVHRTEHPLGHNDNQQNFRLLGRIAYLDDVLAGRLRAAMDEVNYVARGFNKVTIIGELFTRFGRTLEYSEPGADEG